MRIKLPMFMIAVAFAIPISAGVNAYAHASPDVPLGYGPVEAASADSGLEGLRLHVADVVVLTPGSGTVVSNSTPTFSGSGQHGASVVVRDPVGTVLCAAPVTDRGWTCTAVTPMGDGDATIVATQDASGAVSSFQTDFAVKARPAGPQPLLLIGGGIVASIALAAAGLFVINRTRRIT